MSAPAPTTVPVPVAAPAPPVAAPAVPAPPVEGPPPVAPPYTTVTTSPAPPAAPLPATAPLANPIPVAAPPTIVAAPTTAATTTVVPIPSAAPLPAGTTPLKAVKVYSMTRLSPGHYSLLYNNQPFLWSSTTHKTFKSDQIRLSKDSANGPIVAALQMESMLSGPRVLLGGNPDITHKDQWTQWPKQHFYKGEYALYYRGQKHVWLLANEAPTRTAGRAHYRLSDNSGKVLATATGDFDQVHFLEELGGELELLSLLSLLAKRDRELQQAAQAAARAASSGGDGGTCGTSTGGGCGGGGHGGHGGCS